MCDRTTYAINKFSLQYTHGIKGHNSPRKTQNPFTSFFIASDMASPCRGWVAYTHRWVVLSPASPAHRAEGDVVGACRERQHELVVDAEPAAAAVELEPVVVDTDTQFVA